MLGPVALADAAATRAFGDWLGRSLAPCTLLLDGELGAGKTTLVQGLGASLGITDAIVSPTFALISEYLEGRVPLYHLDLYRLSPAEVPSLTPELYWEGQEVEPGWTAIEWPQRLPYQPPECVTLQLSYQPDGSRCLAAAVQGLPEQAQAIAAWFAAQPRPSNPD